MKTIQVNKNMSWEDFETAISRLIALSPDQTITKNLEYLWRQYCYLFFNPSQWGIGEVYNLLPETIDFICNQNEQLSKIIITQGEGLEQRPEAPNR